MINIFSPKKIMLTGAIAALVLALQAISPSYAQTFGKRSAEADKLHIVLLVAGNDGSIGNADMKDIAAVQQAVNVSFANDKHRVVYHDLTGKSPKTGQYFSGTEVLDYLRGMQIGANDNVLVFHSGHGCITNQASPEDSQILTIDGGNIVRKDIRTILQAKQPRALMILTDCCSSFVGGSGNSASRGAAPVASVNVNTVRNLLLKAIGYVSITAAEDGTMAVASFQGQNPAQAGSAFTVALTRLWYRHDVTFVSWEQMFPQLRSETLQASGGAHQARAFQIREHGVTVATPPAAITDEVRNARN